MPRLKYCRKCEHHFIFVVRLIFFHIFSFNCGYRSSNNHFIPCVHIKHTRALFESFIKCPLQQQQQQIVCVGKMHFNYKTKFSLMFSHCSWWRVGFVFMPKPIRMQYIYIYIIYVCFFIFYFSFLRFWFGFSSFRNQNFWVERGLRLSNCCYISHWINKINTIFLFFFLLFL